MKKYFKNLILLLPLFTLIACVPRQEVKADSDFTYDEPTNKTNFNNSFDISIFESIINNIDKSDRFLTYTGGTSRYIGYQICDINNDSVPELYIYRQNSGNSGIASKPYIYEAYKIKEDKPILFINGEVKGDSTCNDCYFATTDNYIINLSDSHSDETYNIYQLDKKTGDLDLLKTLYCEYAYVGRDIDRDTFYMDGKKCSEKEYKNIVNGFKISIFNGELKY